MHNAVISKTEFNLVERNGGVSEYEANEPNKYLGSTIEVYKTHPSIIEFIRYFKDGKEVRTTPLKISDNCYHNYPSKMFDLKGFIFAFEKDKLIVSVTDFE